MRAAEHWRLYTPQRGVGPLRGQARRGGCPTYSIPCTTRHGSPALIVRVRATARSSRSARSWCGQKRGNPASLPTPATRARRITPPPAGRRATAGPARRGGAAVAGDRRRAASSWRGAAFLHGVAGDHLVVRPSIARLCRAAPCIGERTARMERAVRRLDRAGHSATDGRTAAAKVMQIRDRRRATVARSEAPGCGRSPRRAEFDTPSIGALAMTAAPSGALQASPGGLTAGSAGNCLASGGITTPGRRRDVQQ